MARKDTWLVFQTRSNRARKSAKRRRSHNVRLLRWKQGYVIVHTKKGTKRDSHIPIKCIPIGIPKSFSLIHDPLPALKLVKRLKEHLKKRQPLHINLRAVKDLTNDAIILLLSVMSEFREKGIQVAGNYPLDKGVKDRLEQSGFFLHVYGTALPVKKSKNTIFAQNSKIVISELSDQIITDASMTIFGDGRPNEGLQRTLIECMTNTFDHADLHIEGKELWWLSVEHDDINKKVSFAFIDNGSGILKSIVKTSDYKGIATLVRSYLTGGNTNLLKKMLNGDLKRKYKSRTGKPHRGKGIPGIYNAFQRDSFSNLEIITNDVHAKLNTDDFIKLDLDFEGTFIYLEYNYKNTDS